MKDDFLIYGATGYTGRLISQTAADRGLRPILAARNPQKLEPVATRLGNRWRAFALDDPAKLDAALVGVSAVLHAAGPFSATSRLMLDACLRKGVHYLDITGEIDVFEACAARDDEATRAGITVLPGVGFDVVPSDCLAAHMKRRMPGCTKMSLAIAIIGGLSRGTALTGIESLGQAARVRRGGKIVSLAAPLRREVDFGNGPQPMAAVSWGDVATAFHSTGIADISVFFPATGAMGVFARMGPLRRRLVSAGPVRALMKGLVSLRADGPSRVERGAGRAVLTAEGEDESGHVIRSRLDTPEAYNVTALTSLGAMELVMAGRVAPGFQTPSLAFGADFILEIPGVTRADF